VAEIHLPDKLAGVVAKCLVSEAKPVPRLQQIRQFAILSDSELSRIHQLKTAA